MTMQDSVSTPTFFEFTPDWQKPVMVTTKWATAIQTNREAGEQRNRLRMHPRFSIRYTQSAIDLSSFTFDRIRLMQSLGTAVVVPVWTESLTSTAWATNSIGFGASVTSHKFKVGSWIYAVKGTNKMFRKITSIVGSTINLSSSGSDQYTSVGSSWGSFTAGTIVYPCILGWRGQDGQSLVLNRIDRTDAEVMVEEL